MRRRASPWGVHAGDGTLGQDYEGDLHTTQDPWPGTGSWDITVQDWWRSVPKYFEWCPLLFFRPTPLYVSFFYCLFEGS